MKTQNFNRDLLASFVTFIAAVPLSLGIAFASGVEPGLGLAAAVVGGIVVGFLSGSPLTVSGPAAGLSAIVFGFVQQFGLTGLFFIGAAAGILQVACSFLKLGRIFVLVPNSVLEGMLGAIGLTIMMGQLHVIFGQPVPTNIFKSFMTLPISISSAIGPDGMLMPVAILGLLGIMIHLGWQWKKGKHQLLPAALPTVIVVSVLSFSFEMPRVKFSEKLFTLQFDALLQEILTGGRLVSLLVAALVLALVASAESLLTARATDIMATKRDGKKHQSNLDRELLAQGVGNFTSSILGAIPVTAVMVRTAANVHSGAVSRWSTIMHGSWILLAALMFGFALEKIPLAALAAVLVPIGLKLLNFKHLIHTIQKTPLDGVIWLLTLGSILATDLLKGLIIGLVGAFLIHYFNKMNPLSKRQKMKETMDASESAS